MSRKINNFPLNDPPGEFTWTEWFKDVRNSLLQLAGIYSGTGVPSNNLGANGDYYLRSDAGASTHIYFKSAGAWAAIV